MDQTMKVSRTDILLLASEAVEKNNIARANDLMRIIDRSIQSDKDKNIYSKEIELTKEETKLFNNR